VSILDEERVLFARNQEHDTVGGAAKKRASRKAVQDSAFATLRRPDRYGGGS
jgi:hypothetical protein